MKSNIILIIEIFLAMLVLFFFLDKFILNFYSNIGDFMEEDIYASLISLNYQNFSSIDELKSNICNIIKEITPEYAIYINGSFSCGYEDEEYNKIIKTFYIINGEIIEVFVKIK